MPKWFKAKQKLIPLGIGDHVHSLDGQMTGVIIALDGRVFEPMEMLYLVRGRDSYGRFATRYIRASNLERFN